MLPGTKLRQLRRERKLKQYDIARMLETTTSAVCKHEMGHGQPRPELLARWCAIFGITAQELDDMPVKQPESKWKPYRT